jgi:putative phosphoesterase
VRIIIASDLHANWEALAVLPRDYDQLWILGDLVNYGPNPAEVVDFVQRHATHAVKGNHDHAAAFREDARCQGRFRELADLTGRLTETTLQDAQTKYLRDIPLQLELEVDRTRFWLCHAIPSDPLFGYAPADSERWQEECSHLPADIVLVGHTHTQFIKKVGNCLVVNPGEFGAAGQSEWTRVLCGVGGGNNQLTFDGVRRGDHCGQSAGVANPANGATRPGYPAADRPSRGFGRARWASHNFSTMKGEV